MLISVLHINISLTTFYLLWSKYEIKPTSISRPAVKQLIIQYGTKGRICVDICVCNVNTDMGVLSLNFVCCILAKNFWTENFVANFKTLLCRKHNTYNIVSHHIVPMEIFNYKKCNNNARLITVNHRKFIEFTENNV